MLLGLPRSLSASTPFSSDKNVLLSLVQGGGFFSTGKFMPCFQVERGQRATPVTAASQVPWPRAIKMPTWCVWWEWEGGACSEPFVETQGPQRPACEREAGCVTWRPSPVLTEGRRAV